MGAYSDGSVADITNSVTWSSSDDAVATVSDARGSEGLAAGITRGTVTVSAFHSDTGISSEDAAESCSLVVVVTTRARVLPWYGTSGADWNDYVKDDGVDMFSATDTACAPAVDTSCLHGGEMRSLEVTGMSGCTGLSASDALGVFEWECDAGTDPVRMVSTGLKDGRHLSDLIDFGAAVWKENAVTVSADGSPYLSTLPAVWWSNPVVANNDGSDGSDMSEGEIHIVTTNAADTYRIGADRVALIIAPGVTLTGSAAVNEYIVSAKSQDFLWLEGKVDATGDQYGYYLHNDSFSVLEHVQADNGKYGVSLSSSPNNTLTNVTASGNSSGGIRLSSSSNNTLTNVTASGNHHGVKLSSSSDNTLTNVTATGNPSAGVKLGSSSNNNTLTNVTATGNYEGVYVAYSSDNTLTNVTASGNSSGGVSLPFSSNNTLANVTATGNSYGGIRLSSSSNNTLANVTASGNARGVHLDSSSDNTLANVTASGNSYDGVSLSYSSNNYFTGLLKVGENSSTQCYVWGGTNPGLVDGTCLNQGASDSEYSSDTSTLDVLTLPTPADTLPDRLTHTWSDASTTTLLRNAVEIQGDALGNENTLCETPRIRGHVLRRHADGHHAAEVREQPLSRL
jgi:parallel beta-helix repeat protein